MLLAVVGISVAAMADNDVVIEKGSDSCKVPGAKYESVLAVITRVDGNRVYFTLTTEYERPVNAQVTITSDGWFKRTTGGMAPCCGKESREYFVTFDQKVTKVYDIYVFVAED